MGTGGIEQDEQDEAEDAEGVASGDSGVTSSSGGA